MEPIELDQDLLLENESPSTAQYGKEVFETSDQEFDDNDETPLAALETEDPTNELNYDQSRSVFENHILDNATSDFSGRVHDGRYQQMNVDFCKETIPQKLTRIKRELQEIELLDESVSSFQSDKIALGELLSRLETKVKDEADNIEKVLPEEARSVPSTNLPQLTLDFGLLQRLAVLEQQVSKLEVILGPKEFSNNCKPLTTMINDIFQQIKVLKGNQVLLENFQNKLREISTEYEKSLIARKASKDPSLQKQVTADLTTRESRIHNLYESYMVLKRYRSALPHLTARMKTLNSLQFEVGTTVTSVKTVESSLNWMDEQAIKWQQMLQIMEERLNETEAKDEKNKQEITRSLEELENKINSIAQS